MAKDSAMSTPGQDLPRPAYAGSEPLASAEPAAAEIARQLSAMVEAMAQGSAELLDSVYEIRPIYEPSTDAEPDRKWRDAEFFERMRKYHTCALLRRLCDKAELMRAASQGRLMSEARRLRFDAVLCWRLDRFARSTSHLLAALEEFRNVGVDFVSLNESIDTTTPLGKMVFTVVAAVAELERSIIAGRVKVGVARARAKGKRLGRPTGSRVDSAEVVRLLGEGKPFRQTALELEASVGTVYRLAKQSHGMI